MWVVLPYWGGGARAQPAFERRYVPAHPLTRLRALTGALGSEPADRILPVTQPNLALRAIGDELISLGRCSHLRTTTFSRAQDRDPAYRAETNRRSRILTGRRFVPPLASLSNAPYCPQVRAQP